MGRFIAGVVLAGWVPVALAAGAGSGDNAPRSVLESDPYIRLMSEIAQDIDRQCLPAPDAPYSVVVQGVLFEDTSFTPHEKEFLANQIQGAATHVFRARPGVKQRVALRDVGEALTIMAPGSSRQAVQDYIETSQDYDIAIQIKGGRQMDGRFRINLVAYGNARKPAFRECHVRNSTPAELPMDAFPERIVGLEELLGRSPRFVLENSSGTQIIQLRTRMHDDTLLPQIWAESMLRAYERSSTKARQQLQSQSLGDPRNVVPQPTINHLRKEHWSTDIVVSPSRKRGLRLEVAVRPPEGVNASDSFEGLVDPDSFPPLPLDRKVGSGIKTLPLSTEKPERLAINMGGVADRVEVPFTLAQSTVIELETRGADVAALPRPIILDRKSQIIAPAMAGKQRPTLARWRLERGSYTVMLQTRSADPLTFELRTRASFDSLDPEASGTLERRTGDWLVSTQMGPDNAPFCIASTPAAQLEPSNWRLQAPLLQFHFYRNRDSVSQAIDQPSEWRSLQEVAGEVYRNGEWKPLSIGEFDGRLASVKPCEAGGACLNMDTLFELTNGTDLQLFGLRKDGTRGRVLYSLRGYQNAMSMAASLCGQSALARALIVKSRQ